MRRIIGLFGVFASALSALASPPSACVKWQFTWLRFDRSA
jgi:hypothetical protein